MNIYKITQDINNGLDTFSGMVVCAQNEQSARHIIPYTDNWKYEDVVCNADNSFEEAEYYGNYVNNVWVLDLSLLKVELLAKNVDQSEEGIILYSYRAG